MLPLFEVQYFDQEQRLVGLDIFSSWGTFNRRDILYSNTVIKYFCQKQSRSRLKCSILQKATSEI